MHVVIAKVDENLFTGEARSVTVPSAEGELTVLNRHMPLITTLKKGTITVRMPLRAQADDDEKNTPKTFAIEGGFLEVRRDGVTVLL